MRLPLVQAPDDLVEELHTVLAGLGIVAGSPS
jgi:hypothetical protein